DGSWLGECSGQAVKLWNTATGQWLHTLKGHTADVVSVAFSLNARRAASVSKDKTVKIWDITTGHETRTLQGHHGRQTTAVAFSPDGSRLASASWEDRSIVLWNALTGEQIFEAGAGAVDCITFGAYGERFASAGADKTISIWNAATGKKAVIL